MAGPQTPSLDLFAKSRFLNNPTTVALSVANARSTQLAQGMYIVWAGADWFFLQGAVAVAATTSSIPLTANQQVRVYVSGESDDYLAGILAAATATMYIVKVS